MPWIATAPQIHLPDVDMRPVAALVHEQPATENAANTFRKLATEAEQVLDAARLSTRARTMHVIGRLASAKLDGWSIDCSDLIATFDSAKSQFEKVRFDLHTKMRSFQKTVQRSRLPGSNTIGNYVQRLDNALVGWLNDLEDYHHELKDLHNSMLRDQMNAPMARAMDAYAHAVERATGIKSEPVACIDPEDCGAMAYIELPITDEVRFDRVRKRQFTDVIHDQVASIDKQLVGLVALRYTSAQT